MSSPIIVPFNFNPYAVEFKTSSYTVPAGSYAFAEVETIGAVLSSSTLTSGSTGVTPSNCTINSQIVAYGPASLTHRILNNLSVNYNLSSNGTVATINPSGPLSGTGFFVVSGNVAFSTTVTFTFSLPAYAYIGNFYLYRNSTTSYGGSVGLTPVNSLKVRSWVPEGTILSGTGSFLWKVSLYRRVV